MITKQDKKNLLERKIKQIELQKYEQEITLKMQQAYDERDDVIKGTQSTIDKQAKALAVVEEEWKKLK